MAMAGAAGDSSQREMTAAEIRAAARAGELINAMTPGAPLGVVAPEGLPRSAQLVGREGQLEQTLASLTDKDSPAVITISGPSGVGKTAFAAEVVAQAIARGIFPGGALWLPCEGLSGDVGLEAALSRIARALGAELEGETDLEQHKATLHSALHAGNAPRLLLALDSVEPALDATALMDTLAGERISLLLTARQPIQDERARDEPLAPLDSGSATDLFRQRLHQSDPARPTPEDEPLIADAAAAVGALPLMIGLAASLVALTRQPLEQLASHAYENGPRSASASIRISLDRSWAALPDRLRWLLAGLALIDGATFPRGVALALARAASLHPDNAAAGAEIVGAGESWREAAAAALDALIGLRLVDALAAGRLRLHPMIRRYAATRLHELPENLRDTLGAAMAAWWLDYARAHQGQGAALATEATGIMGAITWAHARERHHTLLDLTRAVISSGRARWRSADERHILPWAVEAARTLGDPSQLGAALHDQALFDARAAFEEAQPLTRDPGDDQASSTDATRPGRAET